MGVLRGILLAVRFGLELAALVALGYWGFKTGGNLLAELVLGIGAPTLAVTVSLFERASRLRADWPEHLRAA
jgi:Protein of unknown function (DUF2568)